MTAYVLKGSRGRSFSKGSWERVWLTRDPGATQVCLLQLPDGSVALDSAGGECNTHSV